ncbi:carbohydrate ABC transporter permease [Microbacterium saperdae]|uniref:Carbohydrate ABC transporter membrane protein 1 (CUT1 family) n=1 Tax=Microbacterium saperdae TaxID=69368 RepID=A0A543BIU3_9MICO|nr:sugar ABC transporter permease [Microbacterium saperdae]TQL84726.1 carbohydrate ABC transporter membrane protein 1 (CUT1 family) [Microbacterium saperdae]GGM64591.1 sugar ABC transporter permease [Microbacterium saperdae]
MTAAPPQVSTAGLPPQPTAAAQARRPSGVRKTSPHARREARAGFLWIQPWLIGFLLFSAIPIGVAIYLSFTDWSGGGAPVWIGFDNYTKIFTDDPLFWQSLKVTFIFVALYLPLSLILGLGIAMLMNQKFVGMGVFRTIYYLPSVLSGVAVTVLWGFVFHRDFGVINGVLNLVGIPGIPWLTSQTWVIPAIVIMQLWAVGSSIIIYLGGLQGIPTELYEAAGLDGAGWWRTFRAVTLPMMSPVILLQLILGLIGTFQIFTQAFVMTKGGPDYGSYFFSLYIYDTAFKDLRLGYACALSMVLFAIILIITAIFYGTSSRWVFYAADRGKNR